MNIEDHKIIDKICDEYEAQLTAGASPLIKDFLPLVEDRLRDPLAEALIRAEVVYRLVNKMEVNPQDYATYGARFVEVVRQVIIEDQDENATQSHVQEETLRRDSREIVVDGELKYKLLEEIGQGAFGVVWIAEQRQPFRRKVALKMLNRLVSSRDRESEDYKSTVARFRKCLIGC